MGFHSEVIVNSMGYYFVSTIMKLQLKGLHKLSKVS